MLSNSLKPAGFDTLDKESWDEYRTRQNLPENEAILQFYRQVVYDHFEHFNEHYPDFILDDYEFVIQEYTAQEASDLIRFFRSDAMDEWAEQYDYFANGNLHFDYIIFQTMSSTGTFPFPPIIIDPKLIANKGWNECGRPLHLIEGTHRISYLRHMLQKGLIQGLSRHQFVLLKPREIST
jgi:hypothetical protein